MNFHKRLYPFTLSAFLCSFCGPFQAASAQTNDAQAITLKAFHESGIYKVGETVGWNTFLPPHATPSGTPTHYSYTIKKNNWDILKTGVLDLSNGPAKIEVTVDEPAMLLVHISPDGGGAAAKEITVGAAVAPEQLQPSAVRPADFDEFWESKIKLLKAVPANPELTPGESGNPNVEYVTIKMDHVNGGHVYGQLAKPTGEGKFPGLVIFQWASPPYPLQKQWVTGHAAQGWLTLNIEPHDVLPTEPKAYYDALPLEIKNYQAIGRDDREKCYFLQMYLADYRAVEYLASRPDWDGKTLVVMGTSMGGQQSLCVAGLNPKVTALIVNEPAGCDSNGPLHGRASGYPNWPSDNAKIMETALYFDPVNFASRITVPSMVAMGFVDTTAPPVGIWTAFNQIKGPKKAVPMIDSPHNHLATAAQQKPFTDSSAEWLNTLAKGGDVMADAKATGANATPGADQPVTRMDHNSQLAHEQLLAKATQGHIDVYFEGDSITRRWGASDAQYKAFLANWKQNFFGWNAADFGWGGDTTQNILWRLRNGELDNVNPRVIVLMAGTNNVGASTAEGDIEMKAADVTKGIQAIVETCEQKAPNATIILIGITPRSDSETAMAVINKVNARLSTLADGHHVRFLNINDKLVDEHGHLLNGMTGADGLHLAIAGYQVWADALKPVFTEVLGAPSTVDAAPLPTGDPSAARGLAVNAAKTSDGRR